MKRFLGFILILSMIVSTSVLAETESAADKADLGLQYALGILKQIDEVGEYITRGDAAVYAARMLNVSLSIPEEVNSEFADVTESSIISDAICKLTAMGVVSGNGTVNFEPEANLKKDDAISMFLAALGFKREILESSGYINRSGVLARELDIYVSDGRSDDEDITSDTFFKMMQKVMESKMITLADSKHGKLTYKISDEKDILLQYHDIKHYKGIVTANRLFSITGGKTTQRGYIEIDGKVYKDNADAQAELAGVYTDYYIYDNEALVYIAENKKNEILVINSEDIAAYSNGVYRYSIDDRVKQLTFDFASKPIIYNYGLLMQYSDTYMRPACGYIKLVDNNGDGDYDIMYIMNYKNFYVSGIRAEEELLYIYDDKEPLKKPLVINTNEDEGAVVLNSSLKAATSKAIKAGTVVSAFVNEEATQYTAQVVVVSNDSVSGMVKGVNPNQNVTNLEELVIDLDTYSVFGNISTSDVEVGKAYVFVLDYNGRIAGFSIDYDNSVMAIGYIIDTRLVNDEVQIKLLTELGKIYKYSCANKVRIHGSTAIRNGDALDVFLTGKSGIVGYKVDEEGKLCYLSFPQNWVIGATGAEIYKAFSGGESLYYFGGNRRSFANKYVAKADAKVFTIPANGNTEDYRVGTPEEILVHAKDYANVEGYMLSADSTVLDIVVEHTNTSASTTIGKFSEGNTISVVQSVETTLDEDEEIINKITLIGMNGKQVYTITESAMTVTNSNSGRSHRLTEGDIIRFAVNYKNEIDYVILVHDANEEDAAKKFITNPWQDNPGLASRPIVGKIYNYGENVVQIMKPDAVVNGSFALNQLESCPVGNAVVIVYDSNEIKGKRVRTGKASEFVSYKMASSNCSTVLFDCYEGTARVFVILK